MAKRRATSADVFELAKMFEHDQLSVYHLEYGRPDGQRVKAVEVMDLVARTQTLLHGASYLRIVAQAREWKEDVPEEAEVLAFFREYSALGIHTPMDAQ